MIRRLIPFALALAATAAAAQSNVTRIIVPFGAGGVQDILARAISAELGAALGRSVIVENRTGAGGTIGTASVAKAVPDGHTLILAAASHTINGSLYAKLPYDPLGDFTGVAHIGTVEYVLMIGAALPAKTVKEFVDYAKANPGSSITPPRAAAPRLIFRWRTSRVSPASTWCTCRTKRPTKR